MLSTCEFRDEFAIPVLPDKEIDKAELFDNEKPDEKSFIDSNLLSLESTEPESFEKELVSVENGSFALENLNKDACFKDDKLPLIEQKVEEPNQVLDEPLKRKIDSIDDITNEKNTSHLNKRKRAIVRKSPLELPNEAENIFEDEEVDMVLDKIQPLDEPDYISKKHRQIRKPEIGEKPSLSCTQSVLLPEQIKIKRAKALPEKATKIMKDWFEANLHNPYPTDEERKFMAEQGEINENQVKAWFANKRNRSSHTKSKLKTKIPDEQIKMVNFDQPVKKERQLVKKSDYYSKNFIEPNRCKFPSINLQTCPQYLPNMDLYNYADKNPMNSRFACKQPQVNNFGNYYSYFPKQEPKFIDLNNNYFNPYLSQSNNCEYNRYYPNMYPPLSQNENYINQNFINTSSANNFQYFEPNFSMPCTHSFPGYSDSGLNECSICVNCNQDNIQHDFLSPSTQTQRCDTPPPLVTKNSLRSGDPFGLDEVKSDKNSGSSLRNSQNPVCNYPMSNSNAQFNDFVSNNNYIKSSMLPETINNESVTSILDSLNQVQNNLCMSSGPSCFPPNEYNGSTVTINNINYTNPNGSLINSISSILTKPGSMPSSSTSSIDSSSSNNMSIGNGNESFGSMINMAFNSIINRNSPFQKYASQKCSKSGKIASTNLGEQDSRFSDPKAKEWCLKSHPKLANTLLSSKTNSQSSICLAENKSSQFHQNFG